MSALPTPKKLAQFSGGNEDGKCFTCAFGAADPDGFYCAAKESLALSAWGLSPRAARASDGPCGPDARLYVACACTNIHCPRHGVKTPRAPIPSSTSDVGSELTAKS